MVEEAAQHTLLQLVAKGGWVMLPLGFCSILAVAIIIERFIWGPNRKRVIPEEFEQNVRTLLRERKLEELSGLCRASKTPLARILLTALQHARVPRDEMLEAIHAAGRREASRLQKYIGILGTIAVITPLLGLLGTVFGMIETFQVIQLQGVGNSGALAGGISEALITTASGLTIAIPALVFHRLFLHRIRALVVDMEELTREVIDLLHASQIPLESSESPRPAARAVT